MRRIRCILVAVKEPVAKSLPALAKAAQLARALDARLVLFQAIDAPLDLESRGAGVTGIRNIERTTQEACLERLERHAQRVRKLGVRVDVSAEWDYPAYEAVVRAARRAAWFWRSGAEAQKRSTRSQRQISRGLQVREPRGSVDRVQIPVDTTKIGGMDVALAGFATLCRSRRLARGAHFLRAGTEAINGHGTLLVSRLGGDIHNRFLHAYLPVSAP